MVVPVLHIRLLYSGRGQQLWQKNDCHADDK